MANSITRQRSFPALFIVLVVLLGCIYLDQVGQSRINNWLPGIPGLATLNPSLIILDISVRLPFTVDLILVPAFFILIYSVVILLYPSRGGKPRWWELWHRLGAVFSGLIIVLCCIGFAGLISWLLQGHLPRNVQNGLESLGLNGDIGLPFTTYKTMHLHGNFIALMGLIIGLMIAFGKINRAPVIVRTTRLTREQRMTPYQRMLRERATSTGRSIPTGRSTGSGRASTTPPKPAPAKTASSKPAPAQPVPPEPAPAKEVPQPKPKAPSQNPRGSSRPPSANSRPLCQPEPLFALEPEAVNYRPLS
jgi:hypothetical protein